MSRLYWNVLLLKLLLLAMMEACSAYIPDSNIPIARRIPLIVVFGRPGSGKTTTSNKALEIIQENQKEPCQCLGIDLDVAIPQWMKDNFSKGIYPTLKQRQEVAVHFCDYVENCCQEVHQRQPKDQKLGALVSFSFVNTDLRDIFRERFQQATWVLVDTSEELADERISQRAGHFYEGKRVGKEKEIEEEVDNSEWNFAPVTYPHDILDGKETVETNARKVVEIFQKAIQKKTVL